LRQRILYIVLLVVLVLVGYTILRPKPKPKSRISVSQKPATVKTPATVTKTETSEDTLMKIKVTTDTAQIKKVEKIQRPTKPDTGKAKVSKKPDTSKVTTAKKPISKPPAEEKPEEKVAVWGTDPFVRDWILATEIRDMRLKAVTISGLKSYALINDQILGKGEVIMGKRIVEIEKDKVILEQGGRQFTLFLGE